MKKVLKKNIILCAIVILLLGLAIGCEKKEEVAGNNCNDNKSKETTKENKNKDIYVVLKINMPLNFDYLDDFYEIPMSSYMKKNKIGEIIGDGFPLDDYGPYAADIEFEIKSDKLDELKSMVKGYTFPKGSYLEIEGKATEEFGELFGIRIIFKDLKEDEINRIYQELSKELYDVVAYHTLSKYLSVITAYYYAEDLENVIPIVEKYINSNNYDDKMTINKMETFIKEMEY